MPDTSPKPKPSTRSSIRQSLNFSSVGKAFADAISKDPTKKTKDASRRSSALSTLPSAPRASMSDVKRTSTPDSKTPTTRRRVSASYQRSSSDEQSSKPSESLSPPTTATTRTTTLRPRNLNATSALPKYRPKSVLEPAKPPSPVLVRAGTRRRFSTSDDEKKEQKRPGSAAVTPAAEKTSRPISPLPQRAALQANLTNSVNSTPPTTPSKPRLTTPVSSKSSPARPSKIVKTSTSAALPRPPSSSSSSLSLHPNTTPKSSTPRISTPKTTGLKAKLGLSRSAQDKGKSGSASPSRDSPSPLARHARKNSKLATPAPSSVSGNMSHISEGNSEDEDSDVEDVALLLAPIAAIGAPTPAMPRMQANRKRIAPQTPTRAGLPSRANMSYLSPLPPTSANTSSSSLRPPPQRQNQTANERAMRGSILSWEQLANEASVTLGEDEFGRMLSEIPAPFRSGAASPSLSSQMELSIPESPALSAIDSPGGYGSISQVLLPDVTPSPAMHASIQQSRFSLSPDAAVSDASTATMLRLQLAAAENTAKERLYQIQAMEDELYHLKQAHAHQMEETEKQMVYMEAQWRAGDEQAASAARLEEKLRRAHVEREQAVVEAVARCQEQARVERELEVRAESLRYEALSSARLASSGWGSVRDACEVELDVLRGDRAVLSVLLAQLDHMCYAI